MFYEDVKVRIHLPKCLDLLSEKLLLLADVALNLVKENVFSLAALLPEMFQSPHKVGDVAELRNIDLELFAFRNNQANQLKELMSIFGR